MPRRAITCVGIGGWYPEGLRRQAHSLDAVGELAAGTEHRAWRDALPYGSPPWPEVRTGAKPWAMRAAADAGVDLVLWLDASIYAVAPLAPLWAKIERDGYYVQSNGWNLGQWCNDWTLDYYGLDREAAFAIPELSGMAIGLDLRTEAGRSFLDEFCRMSHTPAMCGPEMNVGGPARAAGCWQPERGIGVVSTDPRVWGHRTDQTVETILAHQRGWVGTPRPEFVSYREGDVPPDPRTVLLNWGGSDGCKRYWQEVAAGKA